MSFHCCYFETKSSDWNWHRYNGFPFHYYVLAIMLLARMKLKILQVGCFLKIKFFQNLWVRHESKGLYKNLSERTFWDRNKRKWKEILIPRCLPCSFPERMAKLMRPFKVLGSSLSDPLRIKTGSPISWNSVTEMQPSGIESNSGALSFSSMIETLKLQSSLLKNQSNDCRYMPQSSVSKNCKERSWLQ